MPEYIEREAVRNALYDADAITMKGVAILNQFPAADVVAVKHGRWNLYGTHYCCSECLIALRDKVPYCPNCGAKMDGGEAE